MDFTFYLALFAAVLSAAVAVLMIIAPKTKTVKDDEWLARLKAIESAIEDYIKTK